jgi:hypothetical protein
MAKKTTTTKAKTKTAKTTTRAAAARTTRKTTKAAVAKPTRTKAAKAVKSTKVTKTTKAAPVKTAKVSRVKSLTSRLRSLNLASAALFAALAVAAGLLMTNASSPVSVGYSTRDELRSASTTVFAPASQNVADVEYRWIVVAVLAVSVVLPLLYATKLRNRYEAAVAGNVVPWRWIDLAVTSALMVETVALFSGVTDLMTLKLAGALMAVTCFLGWLSERRKAAGAVGFAPYIGSIFTGVMPWILIGGYAVATWVYGLVRYPWYVYALMAVVLGGFTLLAVNQLMQLKDRRKWADYAFVERNYLTINLLVKTLFAAVLILGLQQK